MLCVYRTTSPIEVSRDGICIEVEFSVVVVVVKLIFSLVEYVKNDVVFNGSFVVFEGELFEINASSLRQSSLANNK